MTARRRPLTDAEYERAIELCERTYVAARDAYGNGGPTVAGGFLGQLIDLLNGRPLACGCPVLDMVEMQRGCAVHDQEDDWS